MQPIFDEWFAGGGFALGDFVFVVRKNQVFAAAVDVETLTEVRHAHDATFDVPAGPPQSPRRIPFDGAVGFTPGFPEREIADVLLGVLVVLDARTVLEVIHVEVAEFAVGRKGFDGKIDGAVVANVGVLFGEKRLDESDHAGNRVGGARDDMGTLDVECVKVAKEFLRVEISELFERLAGLADGADDFVFHVGDVHDVGDGVPLVFEVPAEQILEHEGTEIADVRVVVNGRAAGVETNFARLERDEVFFLSGQRIEEFHSSTETIAIATTPSLRPVKPMCSLVVALMPIWSGRIRRLAPMISCILGMCGEIFGACAMMAASMLLMVALSSRNFSATSRRMIMLFMSFHFMSVSG
ncbi:MAG: hypothetical protein PCFJNLEI_04097 [Verrucomicrobiae bacterium]|nr:hypothetical protein [Verrucomicrobiae bacterium]